MISEEQQNQAEVFLVEIEDDLWRQFSTLTNEVVIEPRGRKIFPKLDYYFEGLNAQKMYEIVLEFHQVDDVRYRFWNGQWVENGASEVPSIKANENAKKIRHVDGVKTGKEWMRFAVNFDHIKLTTYPITTNPSFVSLHSLHKYVPVLSINEVSSNMEPIAVAKIEYTQFIAVTKYQNPALISLRKHTNPRAQQYCNNRKRRHSSSSPEFCRRHQNEQN